MVIHVSRPLRLQVTPLALPRPRCFATMNTRSPTVARFLDLNAIVGAKRLEPLPEPLPDGLLSNRTLSTKAPKLAAEGKDDIVRKRVHHGLEVAGVRSSRTPQARSPRSPGTSPTPRDRRLRGLCPAWGTSPCETMIPSRTVHRCPLWVTRSTLAARWLRAAGHQGDHLITLHRRTHPALPGELLEMPPGSPRPSRSPPLGPALSRHRGPIWFVISKSACVVVETWHPSRGVRMPR